LSLARLEIKEGWSNKGWRAKLKTRQPVWEVLRHSAARPRHLLPSWKRHWLDLLAFVILPLLLFGLAYRAYSLSQNAVPHVDVSSTVGLPVFHKITKEVELKAETRSQGAFTSVEKVLDRYTLAAIPAGSLIKENQLLSPELSAKMQDRRILTVPVKPGTYSSTLSPPSEAIMLLSPHELAAEMQTVAFDVIVLSLEKSGDTSSATVALPEDKFNIAAKLLASHDAYLGQKAQ